MKLTPSNTFEMYCPKCAMNTLLIADMLYLTPGHMHVRCAHCDTLWSIRIEYFERLDLPTIGKSMWFKNPEAGMKEVFKQPEGKMKDVMDALAELYTAYYTVDSDATRQRARVEKAMARLMIAYNAFLG